MLPNEVIFINDKHTWGCHHTSSVAGDVFDEGITSRVWDAPWHVGVPTAMNIGVALAQNECVLMLCADDTLHPEAVERCARAYAREGERDGYYWLPVRYSDSRPDQFVPCGAAMVTKGLWCMTGGFPIEAAAGAPDAALLSIMLVHFANDIIPVDHEVPLYNYRVHDESFTAGTADWQGVILSTRDILTRNFTPPTWGYR